MTRGLHAHLELGLAERLCRGRADGGEHHPPEERDLASRFLGYPENSVGRLMSPHFVRVRAQWTLARAQTPAHQSAAPMVAACLS